MSTATKKARAVGFNHVALEVGDIEEALAFYGRLFEITLRGKSETSAFVDLGDQFIAFQKGRVQGPDDGRHFGLVVTDKEAVRAALSEADIAPLPGPFLDFLKPDRNCGVSERSVHQSTERSARHGAAQFVKERQCSEGIVRKGHGARMKRGNRARIGRAARKRSARPGLQPERIGIRHALPFVLGTKRRHSRCFVEPGKGVELLC
jgi:catechol 2,3-dioxygenase-like lactoylglutathione lyase family enzyme